MGLSAAQETVLDELAATVPEGVTWCVFGSTNAALRGLGDDPSDVDVLTTEPGAERIRDVLADEFVGTRELGVSRIDEYRLFGEELEVVYSERAKSHQEPLVDLGNVELDWITDRGIPLLPPERLLETYRRMGKHDTAARLDARLPEQSDR